MLDAQERIIDDVPEPNGKFPPAPSLAKVPHDIEAMAAAARAHRIAECEKAVLSAIGPILKNYHCRLGTFQEIVDGRPGPVRISVFAEA